MLKNFFRLASVRFRQWSADLERVPFLGKLVRKSKTATLPGLQKVPVYDVARFFAQSLNKGVVFQRAAAITYRIFVALIPMVIALFSSIAFLGSNFQNALISLLESLVPPYVWPAVSGMITDLVMRQNGTLSSFMLVIGIYFTVVCINAILVAMNTSYFNEENRNILKQILLSVRLMFLTFLIIIVVAVLFIVSSFAIDYIDTHFINNPKLYSFMVHFLKWVLVYASIYFLISIFYYLAPVKRGNYRFFSAGSSTCTILLVLFLWIINIYFSNFSNYNIIYGSLGALFAILLWINWSASIFLICYDLNVSIAKAKSENKKLSDNLKIKD
ncbi:MAG: YihY/virulence factor BrkB family protein [Bacteroidales bacterium]|nr:YihY/virulence factor BrkB family protein [Bacteroidales bacterium]MDY6348739.1 YihY/virulence factor BrkB family protein [Bacteroidales bacterium]